jgi:hypothetical protein
VNLRRFSLLALFILLVLLSLVVELPLDERLTPLLHLVSGALLTAALVWSRSAPPAAAALIVSFAALLLEPAQGLLTQDRRPDALDALGGVAGALLGALLVHRVVARDDR